jgi:hypothetical protein
LKASTVGHLTAIQCSGHRSTLLCRSPLGLDLVDLRKLGLVGEQSRLGEVGTADGLTKCWGASRQCIQQGELKVLSGLLVAELY